MSYYWIGDKPVSALLLVPTRGGEPWNLSPYTGVSLLHVQPDGVSHERSASASLFEGAVKVQFAGETWFPVAGLHRLRLLLTAADGRQERLDEIPIVVQAEDGWHTLPSARSEWKDAPSGDDGDDMRLYVLLELAKKAVLAFAPDLDDDEAPPLDYRHAQLLQARNIFNASRVDPASGDAGGDSFALTPFPLDWTVKQLLRPKRARPVAL